MREIGRYGAPSPTASGASEVRVPDSSDGRNPEAQWSNHRGESISELSDVDIFDTRAHNGAAAIAICLGDQIECGVGVLGRHATPKGQAAAVALFKLEPETAQCHGRIVADRMPAV